MSTIRRVKNALQPAGVRLDVSDDVDRVDELADEEEEQTQPKSVLFVAFSQLFLIGFSYSIVIPTARQYTETLGAPSHFEGYVVGASSFGAVLCMPLYRWMMKRSMAASLQFQVICIQLGSVLYSLAKIANKLELLVAGRILAGFGCSSYPVYQFIAERIGKKHRSGVMSASGVGRYLGFALGPAVAAVLVYVDFNIGDLSIDKETNGGWTVALYCAIQTVLIVSFFPRDGSNMIQKGQGASLPPDTRPLGEKVMHYLLMMFLVVTTATASFFMTGWQVAATNIIQTKFNWSIQLSALLVGGIASTAAVSSPIMGKLSYRFQDRQILTACLGLQLLASVTLFDFSPILYLIGSVVYFNSVTLQVIFNVSLSSKVCLPHQIEPLQSWINTIALATRGLGAIFGANLSVEQLAIFCASGALFSLVGALFLYRRMHYLKV